MAEIMTAAREYANRPEDERYSSVDSMLEAAMHQRAHSGERNYNLKDLRVLGSAGAVQLASPKGAANFTHWSFGQFCRMLGAPAGYLRDLDPRIAADALNYGITKSSTGQTASLLLQAPNGKPEPTVRACTSDSYARVWDAELYGAVKDQIMAHDPDWQLPPVWGGGVAGAYRGDRDSFLILVNGGSIVDDPTLASRSGDSGTMFRGLLIRNSEVGAASITIETILYRFICGNHILWGATVDRRFKRRHVGTKVAREAAREISRFAYSYTRESADRDNAIIRGLIDRELASTRDAVIDELRTLGATIEQAEEAYKRCEQTEACSPRSFWGAVQGLTRVSQDFGFQDQRFQLDQIAAKLLSRGARLVAA